MKSAIRMKKRFVSCSKTPRYIKVKSAIPLHGEKEAASKPLTSEDTELLKVSATLVRVSLS
jgi:hypothetical protein